jgi:hypothetical protein
MAKRKKANQAESAAPMSSSDNKTHVSIDSAENGFVVRVSGEGKDHHYTEKTLVATSPRHALRVAAQHIPGIAKRAGKKKSGRGKKFASKAV